MAEPCASLSASDEQQAGSSPPARRLRLYVANHSEKSMTAIGQLKKICETYLVGPYELEIIDLMQHPAQARSEQIVAIPTLICQFSESTRKVIGDLTNTQRVLQVLGLGPAQGAG